MPLTEANYDLSSYKIDNQDKREDFNIILSSGKKDDIRFYRGKRTEIYNKDIGSVAKAALNFKLRCNNNLKDHRLLTSKSYICPFPSKGIIETQVIKNLKEHKRERNEIERFIVQNRIKKRGDHAHVDLIKIYRYQENKKQVIRAHQIMLTDEEALKYINDPIQRQSYLLDAEVLFTIREISKEETSLTYDYINKTNHWLLNKSLIVSQFFDGMSRSIDRVFKSIDGQLKRVN